MFNGCGAWRIPQIIDQVRLSERITFVMMNGSRDGGRLGHASPNRPAQVTRFKIDSEADSA